MCYDVSRLSRRPQDLAALLDRNVRVATVTGVDLEDPAMLRLTALMAEADDAGYRIGSSRTLCVGGRPPSAPRNQTRASSAGGATTRTVWTRSTASARAFASVAGAAAKCAPSNKCCSGMAVHTDGGTILNTSAARRTPEPPSRYAGENHIRRRLCLWARLAPSRSPCRGRLARGSQQVRCDGRGTGGRRQSVQQLRMPPSSWPTVTAPYGPHRVTLRAEEPPRTAAMVLRSISADLLVVTRRCQESVVRSDQRFGRLT